MGRMLEKAKEELEMLETLHPNRFHYLKNELNSFISLLQSQLIVDSLPSTSYATTQASTTMRRKRKRVCLKNEIEIENGKKERKQKDRVDILLEKAQACLRKIQDFKFTLHC
ncbi:uncharacterized protein LOC130817325 [Amaranthus tricolor]|uniref:uncharacterized protein LOC130817325 n=1 Tax=Amaranthus tricolor TaxID=29722 RepID=UPI002582F04B|nr:uncharacterized protein LOC130817325 [Amaranthus tricolor]